MSFGEYLDSRRELLLFEFGQHASMVAQCVLLAALIGVPLAVVSYRRPALAAVTTTAAGLLYTVPAFALFGLLIAVVGLGVAPAVIAITAYAVLPIVRNGIVGLRGVDAPTVEAARGMGMGRIAVLCRVELPMAWPVLLAGIRTATQLAMGIGAIAAYVGGPGLGEQIFSGLARLGAINSLNATLTGVLGIALLAVLFDVGLLLLGRLTINRGLRA